MFQSWSSRAVVGPNTKECQEVAWPSWHCWGPSVQRAHILKGCLVGGGLSAPILLVQFWRVSFVTSRYWLNIEDCFGTEASLCTDYLLITGRKLVTVQWRRQVDTTSPKQSKLTSQTPCPS